MLRWRVPCLVSVCVLRRSARALACRHRAARAVRPCRRKHNQCRIKQQRSLRERSVVPTNGAMCTSERGQPPGPGRRTHRRRCTRIHTRRRAHPQDRNKGRCCVMEGMGLLSGSSIIAIVTSLTSFCQLYGSGGWPALTGAAGPDRRGHRDCCVISRRSWSSMSRHLPGNSSNRKP
jgi:hypothetical protein